MNNWIFSSENFFHSDRNTLTLVEPILMNLRNQFMIPDEKYYNIMIAVTEAVNNALNHGNKLNHDKIVEFTVRANNERLMIKVTDQGEGFNPDDVPDCTDPANILKSSGRGVYIIKELMDEVLIDASPNGTKMEMVYYLNK
ncbi:MAG TPA: ATP-binding protein [Candidatus Kapabacteria bacterium]|nr:ATP-binding protein [Candidatus Kapabacteria bacterium]